MSSSLEALSTEVVEMVVTRLTLDDLRALRLTSSLISKKASNRCFGTYFSHKTMVLSPEPLQKVFEMTKPDRLGCLIQRCTITGLAVHSTPMMADEEDRLVQILVTVFRNLKQYSVNGAIQSLFLSVSCGLGPCAQIVEPGVLLSWKMVWDAAKFTFRVVMAALEVSELLVHEQFDIFGGVRGCSLACDAFHNFFGEQKMAVANFQVLKRLKMSLSASYGPQRTHSSHSSWYLGDNEQCKDSTLTLRNLRHLIQALPNLEELDLHWYNGVGSQLLFGRLVGVPRDKYSQSAPVKRLRRCTLRGIYPDPYQLLYFIRAVQPAALTLVCTHIDEEGYDRLFEYFNGSDHCIEELVLDDLLDCEELIHYRDEPGCPKFPYYRQPEQVLGPSTLTRVTGHSKGPILYSVCRLDPLRTPQYDRWCSNRWDEYGGRHFKNYDFHRLNSPLRIDGTPSRVGRTHDRDNGQLQI